MSEGRVLTDISAKLSIVAASVGELKSTMSAVEANQGVHTGLIRNLAASQASGTTALHISSLLLTPEPAAKRVCRQMLISSTPNIAGDVAQEAIQTKSITPTAWTVSTFVFKWYADELFIVDPALKGTDKTDLNRLAKLLCYLKCFMPDKTVPARRPPPANLEAIASWETNLRKLGICVEEKVLRHFVAFNVFKRVKQVKLFSAYKAFQAMPAASLPVVVVADDAVHHALSQHVQCLFYPTVASLHSN